MDNQRKNHPDPESLLPKKIAPINYRPLTCLPIMWKILMVQIKDEI